MSMDMHRAVRGVEVLDLLPSSDHLPLRCVVTLPGAHPPSVPVPRAPPSASPHPGYRWDKASDADLQRYCQLTALRLSVIELPRNALVCSDVHCNCPQHSRAIDALYDEICHALRSSSDEVLDRVSSSSDAVRHVVPGWNDLVRDQHTAARNAYVFWRNSGKPRQGPAFEEMRQTRRAFKLALRRRQTKTAYAKRLWPGVWEIETPRASGRRLPR